MPPSLLTPELTRATVRRFLAERVRSGSLRPGDRLSPAALAGELGVSATPLREALIELVRDGYLDNRSQHGFAVRLLSAKEVKDLYPLIASLESLAVREGTFSEDRLDELDRINSRFTKARKPAEMRALDDEWHSTLVAASENETLHEMLGVLKARVQRYEDAYVRFSGNMPVSAKQHRSICRALRSGDAALAIKGLEENWRSGIQFLVPWLEQHQSERREG